MGTWFDTDRLQRDVEALWEHDLLAVLEAYTRIPCLSPAFDPRWETSGQLAEAAELLASWWTRRPLADLSVDVHAPAGRTPVLVAEAPATGSAAGDVLVYGHLDKQPPQGTWRDGLGPFEPVRDGDRLYGRGTADDGYAALAAAGALEALDAQGVARPRVLVLIEASEESGSPDLAAHLDDLAGRIGRPDLVVCLDSGALTYDRLWRTSSLRGNVVASVRVDVLTEGVHSGLAGGVVPSSFRVLRQLLSRIEDERTGEILLPSTRAEVPASERADLRAVAEELPEALSDDLPTVPGLRLCGDGPADQLVARAWSPALAVTGIDGVPAVADGGNVLRPYTTAKISLRLPPTVDAAAAAAELVEVLGSDPPQGAQVQVRLEEPADGWLAPEPAPWVGAALDEASLASFGRPHASYGEGGSIPFLATLARRFPGIQLVATGVLGPGSNAHGPNEFLHLPMARAVTCALAHLVAAAAR
jgi:acetylornithine deacetylase/succinyl-diaminopimelate desuccinylase-like protein